MPTDWKCKKKNSSHKNWNFSIWNKLDQTMVRQCDVRWNQIEASLVLMYTKMRDLGFRYDGQEVIVPVDEVSNV